MAESKLKTVQDAFLEATEGFNIPNMGYDYHRGFQEIVEVVRNMDTQLVGPDAPRNEFPEGFFMDEPTNEYETGKYDATGVFVKTL